jgi:hypothetical protein
VELEARMSEKNRAREALTRWWCELYEPPTDFMSVPHSGDVVGLFLQYKPRLRGYKADLTEWARHQIWAISRSRWEAVTIRVEALPAY